MSIQQGINQLITQSAFLFSQTPLAAKQKDKYIQQRKMQEKEESALKASTLAGQIESSEEISKQRDKLIKQHGEDSAAVREFDKETESRIKDANRLAYEADRELALMDPEKYGERYTKNISETAYNKGYYTSTGRRRKVPKSRQEAMDIMKEKALAQIQQQNDYIDMTKTIQGGDN